MNDKSCYLIKKAVENPILKIYYFILFLSCFDKNTLILYFIKKNYFKTYMQILEIIRTFMLKMDYSLNKNMKKVKFINMRIILSPLTFFFLKIKSRKY